MTDTTIRRLNTVQLMSGPAFLLSFLVLLILGATWRDAPNWIIGPLVINMGVGAVTTIAAFFIQGGQKTREDRVESLRGKVAWGVWAAKELEKMGVDPTLSERRGK